MSKIRFEMKPVEKKRKKTSAKRSIFDPILDKFIESGHNLVQITIEGKRPGYVGAMLNKRINKRELDVVASWAQDVIYLEKKPTE